MNFQVDNLLIGVSGGVHSHQLPTYLYKFRESFAKSIRIIMTQTAQQMIRPDLIRLYVDDRVFTDIWDESQDIRAPHIQLPFWADLFVVLPASADILGKAANGIADDLLSSAIVASPTPIVFAPAMNPVMWESKAVKRNVERLRLDGHYIIPPSLGISVTTGRWDVGLGPTPDSVIQTLRQVVNERRQAEYWSEATSTPPVTPATTAAAK